ncbi:hypothetical protein ABT169_21655 [Streptomyces sp. NPDC001616]|uniref:DUF7298 domain-containing protein n=1 Tax=Streptomyces sp. NPDC001616 TaxID=3156648 RepID=UPI003321D6F1
MVALTTDLDDSAYAGDAETIVYQLQFRAAPKRIYKVTLRVGRADGTEVGDATARGAKNSVVSRCRWASGATVTTSNPHLGDYRVPVFANDSSTSMGVHSSWYLLDPPAGTTTVGISIYAGRAAATYGQVRIIADGNAILVIEDVGPYSE